MTQTYKRSKNAGRKIAIGALVITGVVAASVALKNEFSQPYLSSPRIATFANEVDISVHPDNVPKTADMNKYLRVSATSSDIKIELSVPSEDEDGDTVYSSSEVDAPMPYPIDKRSITAYYDTYRGRLEITAKAADPYIGVGIK